MSTRFIMFEEDFYKKVGKRIQQIRLEKAMTQLDVAALCNYEKSTISRIESGRTNLTLKTLYLLSKALNVSMKDLVDI